MQSDLKTVSNDELLEKTKTLVGEERRITTAVLWHIREIEKRRLFAEIGYSSLFEYCTNELKYSESAAMRRITAMRALKELPELEESLKSGDLTVTTLSKVQSFFRSERLHRQKSYTIEEKRSLFKSLNRKSQKEIERSLFTLSPTSACPQEKEKLISQTQTEIRFTLDNKLLEKLKTIRNLLAHKLKDPSSYAELLDVMCDVVLKAKSIEQKQIDKSESKNIQSNSNKTQTRVNHLVALTKVAPNINEYVNKNSHSKKRKDLPSNPFLQNQAHSRYIPNALILEIFKQANYECTYIHPKTNQKCASKFKLQIEHKIPFAKGGSSKEIKNLTLLCSAHQQLKAIQEYGLTKMKKYIPDLEL